MTEHIHELYEDEYPLHCDECGDSFSALAIIREQRIELEKLRRVVTAARGHECSDYWNDWNESCDLRAALEALEVAQ